eukprot:8064203-Ditylum_brightwellii.AAC.1
MLTDAAGVNTPWWEAGAGGLVEGTYGYNLATLIAIQVPVMGFFEYTRIKGWQETGSSGMVGFVSPAWHGELLCVATRRESITRFAE